MLIKKGSSKIIAVFAVLFVVLILTPILLNQYYNFMLRPVASERKAQTFVVRPGDEGILIAENLKEAGLIRSDLAFRLLVAQMRITKSIQAGDFLLSPSMSSREIAEELTHGAIDIWVTLPEGLRKEEQAEKIESILKFGSNDTYQFDKKAYIEKAEEGYMFPDTYLIPKDASAEQVADMLMKTFRKKVDAKILSVKPNGLTEKEIVTLASLIEREAKTNEEKPIIAGILINRIDAGIALQIDATVQYGKGYSSVASSWWPQITQEDYRLVKSPYNTYLSQGLPPGPIANPGIESIKAAANPQDTSYLYYLHDSEGKIHYARTIEEHGKNIEEYL